MNLTHVFVPGKRNPAHCDGWLSSSSRTTADGGVLRVTVGCGYPRDCHQLADARPLRFIPPIVLGWHPFGPPEATRTRTRAG